MLDCILWELWYIFSPCSDKISNLSVTSLLKTVHQHLICLIFLLWIVINPKMSRVCADRSTQGHWHSHFIKWGDRLTLAAMNAINVVNWIEHSFSSLQSAPVAAGPPCLPFRGPNPLMWHNGSNHLEGRVFKIRTEKGKKNIAKQLFQSY